MRIWIILTKQKTLPIMELQNLLEKKTITTDLGGELAKAKSIPINADRTGCQLHIENYWSTQQCTEMD
jgi:hypothetical protein